MALSDLVVPTKEFQAMGTTLVLHPLTLEDLGIILRDHREEAEDVFNNRKTLDEIVTKAPMLVAKIIAFSCREPDAVEVAKKIPLGTQLECLHLVWDLTVPDEKQFQSFFRTLVVSLPHLLENLGLRSGENERNSGSG